MNIFSKDSALLRRFHRIDVEEPSFKDCVKIINGLVPTFEKFHNVHYTKQSVIESITLAKRYMHDRLLPDSAIDLIDLAGSKMKIDSSKNIFSNNNVIRKRHIEKVVAKMMRIPSSTIGNNSKIPFGALKGKMQENLFGQDPAIDKVVSAIKISQVGLKNENKPIGSFLFARATGVGKTEFVFS